MVVVRQVLRSEFEFLQSAYHMFNNDILEEVGVVSSNRQGIDGMRS